MRRFMKEYMNYKKHLVRTDGTLTDEQIADKLQHIENIGRYVRRGLMLTEEAMKELTNI